jgi:hypothetical protein
MKTVRATVVLLILAFGIFDLAAGNPWQYERTYFTDASKTTECGHKSAWCAGSTSTGCNTIYYETEYVWPCGGTATCEDNADNDGDGMIDFGDASCFYWGVEVNEPSN